MQKQLHNDPAKSRGLLVPMGFLLVIVVILKVFVIDFFHVESNSMSPKLKEGDYIIILKRHLIDFEQLKGKVVVFNSPYDNTKLVKRYAAGNGEAISNFELFGAMEYQRNKKIKNGEFFATGDNKEVSFDSRFFGTVQEKEILGKALFIYWSKDSTGIQWNRIFSDIE